MVTGTTALTDERIQRDVLEELKWEARVQPNEIGVAVKDGIVTLTGSVDAYSKKWAAEQAAHRVRGRAEREEAERAAWAAPGVTEVDNRITISY